MCKVGNYNWWVKEINLKQILKYFEMRDNNKRISIQFQIVYETLMYVQMYKQHRKEGPSINSSDIVGMGKTDKFRL